MTTLEAYNQILAYVGEEPISDIETPSYGVNLIASQFNVIKRRILGLGHSFNTDKLTLSPDVDGNIAVPTTFLKPPRFRAGVDNLVVREGYVWDTQTGTRWSTAVEVLATLDIAFDSIPEPFQHWVYLEVAAHFRIRLNGVDSTAAFLKQEALKAKAIALNSEPANATGATGWGQVISAYGA